MIAVIAVFPQANNQLAGIDVALQATEKASQVDFVQIRQGADNFERLIFRNIEIIGGFVAHNNFHLFALAQQIDDIAHQQGRQVEVRGAQRQFLIGTGHQMVNGFIQHALLTQPNQRRYRQLIVARLVAKLITGSAQTETK
ncbi:hypothetical protein D3C71_1719220 [compost metagenome]